MLNEIYKFGRMSMMRGWRFGVVLIILTLILGTWGFYYEPSNPLKPPEPTTFSDALYKAVSLLAIQTGAVSTANNPALEWARWFGMIIWGSAVISVVVRLFRESTHRLLVKVVAKDHWIVAGLGRNGSHLVKALRDAKLQVVVIESDRDHPAIEICQETGAVVLFGELDDPKTLEAAVLKKAKGLLALFGDEQMMVSTATAAQALLPPKVKNLPARLVGFDDNEERDESRGPVRCILRLTEPGLLDVMRQHVIKTNKNDQFELQILNAHEIAAHTMVREATANCSGDCFDKIMILGLGTHHRLGEMVVLRAAKDRLIEHNGNIDNLNKLVIHVYDEDAAEWMASFESRYPFIKQLCEIKPEICWARKVGFSGERNDFDAAFVCIAEEAIATAQAVRLREIVLTQNQPIMVRVVESRSGYGKLINTPNSGWKEEGLHAIGLEDPLLNAETALMPESEMRAGAIHQTYRTLNRLFYGSMSGVKNPLDVSWLQLPAEHRVINRLAAGRHESHLKMIGEGKTKSYRIEYRPTRYLKIQSPLLREFSDSEIDLMAEEEHKSWMKDRKREGWTYGDPRNNALKKNPLLVPYARLTDGEKEYNKEFIRMMPKILAKEDYVIVDDNGNLT